LQVIERSDSKNLQWSQKQVGPIIRQASSYLERQSQNSAYHNSKLHFIFEWT